MYYIKKVFSTLFLGLLLALGFFGGLKILFATSTLPTFTSGQPLSVDSLNQIVSNLFWGTGSNGIYYTGNIHASGVCIDGDCKGDWSEVSSVSTSMNYTGTCDSSHKGATGIFDTLFKVCNGNDWATVGNIANYFDGVGTNDSPYRLNGESPIATTVTADSCQYYNINAVSLNDGLSRNSGNCGNDSSAACLDSGVYRVTVGGETRNVYCDMETDGGGWTFIVGIASDKTHNTSAENTPGNLISLGGKGKYSDVFINNIRTASSSEGVVKLECGGNIDYFDYRSTVWHATHSANPNGVGWDVYTQPWGTAPFSGGGSGYPNQPGPRSYNSWGNNVIYGYNGWNGCHSGAGSSTGNTWLR